MKKQKQSITVESLIQFYGLRSELRGAIERAGQIAKQISDLELEKARAESEASKLKAMVSNDFGDLPGVLNGEEAIAGSLISSVQVEAAGYVKNGTKRRLLRQILRDYGLANPDAKTISYRTVKSVLEKDYGIQCKSIANFFVGMLDELETEGGNRNKQIVLPDS